MMNYAELTDLQKKCVTISYPPRKVILKSEITSLNVVDLIPLLFSLTGKSFFSISQMEELITNTYAKEERANIFKAFNLYLQWLAQENVA